MSRLSNNSNTKYYTEYSGVIIKTSRLADSKRTQRIRTSPHDDTAVHCCTSKQGQSNTLYFATPAIKVYFVLRSMIHPPRHTWEGSDPASFGPPSNMNLCENSRAFPYLPTRHCGVSQVRAPFLCLNLEILHTPPGSSEAGR